MRCHTTGLLFQHLPFVLIDTDIKQSTNQRCYRSRMIVQTCSISGCLMFFYWKFTLKIIFTFSTENVRLWTEWVNSGLCFICITNSRVVFPYCSNTAQILWPFCKKTKRQYCFHELRSKIKGLYFTEEMKALSVCWS